MIYRIETTSRFEKEFKKLDKFTQKMIRSWISKNLADREDPRSIGKALTADRKGQWRYRIGDYRLICLINDHELIILALAIGHRKEVYFKE
ncbi:MAG: type II toxin-antitoxin system RelE/ParE family toxin [Peptostreptococcaceae bacterium]|nr:type II toxin-antitoxin system RelE/ParE family toxin [Peptostreptococcaceae bacterium]